MAWSPATGSPGTKRSSAIAVATAKGNLQLFSIRDKRTTPLVGKHTKKAVCMAWSAGNVLAIASQDKTVSVQQRPRETHPSGVWSPCSQGGGGASCSCPGSCGSSQT